MGILAAVPPARRIVALLAALVLLAAPAGCGFLDGDGPEEAAEAYVAAWSAGDDAAAAALTDDPAVAHEALTGARADLDARGVTARVEQVRESGERAEASLAVDWDLGDGRRWSHLGELELGTDQDGAWLVRWSPAAVHPQLAAGQRLALRTEPARPGPVVDRTGATLLEPTPVVSIVLDRLATGDLPAVAGALARALGPLDPAITPQTITDGAAATPDGQGYRVAVLREADYRTVRDAIHDLPGVRFSRDQRLLAPDAGFGRQVLAAVRAGSAARLDGVAGWSVHVVDAGTTVTTLTEEPPRPGSAVTVSLDRAVQTAAEDAVEPLGEQAMLVAVEPSTGAVLAVAQNDAADAEGPLALTGRYPPGSTFKIATATAAITEDGLRAATPVACPAETSVGGRPIPNADRFELGTVPLRTAFARSCNTTFAQLAVDLDPGALPAAALSLGLGADYAVPGLPTITGSVPAATEEVQRAENGIGQGQVLAGPFSMALVAATVARGAPVVPQLYPDRPTEVLRAPTEPDVTAITELRPMMRAVVTEGTAEQLGGRGELFGKTGTAEFTADGRAHGWFVGYRDDVAFAVLVVDGGSSAPALEVADRLLAATAG